MMEAADGSNFSPFFVMKGKDLTYRELIRKTDGTKRYFLTIYGMGPRLCSS